MSNALQRYYTLASTSVPLGDLPAAIGKQLPHYPSVPAGRMGRLAIDQNFKGQVLGGALLADAFERAASAKDASAASFYQHHGFIALPDSPLTLFLPLATAGLV
jgi:GNAT superfamily N-acetyltransferase